MWVLRIWVLRRMAHSARLQLASRRFIWLSSWGIEVRLGLSTTRQRGHRLTRYERPAN